MQLHFAMLHYSGEIKHEIQYRILRNVKLQTDGPPCEGQVNGFRWALGRTDRRRRRRIWGHPWRRAGLLKKSNRTVSNRRRS